MVRIGALLVTATTSTLALGISGAVDEAKQVKNIAIIGAGAAGSSASYYLRQFADDSKDVAVNITVFEKTARIGGRTLTVGAYNNSLLPVELGASIFVPINYILYGAAQEFGLALSEGLDDADGTLGVWDGKEFRYQQNEEGWKWWNYAKMFWKYGMAPYRTQKLVQSTVSTFLKMYDAPWFPFRSLTQRAFDLELTKVTALTGKQFLEANKITESFSSDIIQAATRVNYASNLEYIHGLECMVSMAPDGAVQVVGGNWQIFSTMVNRSGAAVNTETKVTSISRRQEESGNDGPSEPQYLISTKRTGSDDGAADETYPVAFDNVIIASPWQYSDIEAGEDTLQHTIDKIPYVKLHVTLFSSPFQLSPEFFRLPPGTKVPSSVLTTLPPNEKPEPGSAAAGTPGFFSISRLRTVINPGTQKPESLYKIFSPADVTSDFLSALLGVPVPESITGSTDTADVAPISWYYPHVFHSYPIEYPRVTFQDPIVGRGLYYTSGMESFISTMETNALMGKNVARLIIDDLMGAGETSSTPGQGAEKVLGGEGTQVRFTGKDMGEL